MTTPTSRPGHALRTTRRRGREPRDVDRRAVTDGGLPSLTQTLQVLVDGGGVPGLALAALLRQAGHEPVVVDAADDGRDSTVTTLWPPGLRVLDALGVGDSVRSAGRPLDAVVVRTETADAEHRETLTAAGDEPTPFLVDTRALVDALADRVTDFPRLSEDVAAVNDQENALEVEFANGVREFFDLAVAADGRAPTARASTADDRRDWTVFSGVEVPLNGDDLVPALALDSWRDGLVAQLVPPPNADADGVLRLLAAPDATVDVAEVVASAFPDVSEDVAATWTAAAADAEWTRIPQSSVDTAEWATDRVAYCGSAAFAAPRVTGVQPALALEDVWVLADELAGDFDDVAASLSAYARRRRRRLRTVSQRVSATEETDGAPTAHVDSLAATSRLRATALGALSAGSLAELQRDVPARL